MWARAEPQCRSAAGLRSLVSCRVAASVMWRVQAHRAQSERARPRPRGRACCGGIAVRNTLELDGPLVCVRQGQALPCCAGPAQLVTMCQCAASAIEGASMTVYGMMGIRTSEGASFLCVSSPSFLKALLLNHPTRHTAGPLGGAHQN